LRRQPEVLAYGSDAPVYAPTGFFLGYTAWRSNVSGIVKGPLPFFWGVSKTA
jgi:peptide/nickel transport system substrate-binding protein